MLPRIAIVGRPNVGKSALFNRLAKRRISIVHDKPGVTRDRIAAQCWIGKRDSGFHFELTDTGGIGATLDDGFAQATRAEADVAINAAELILFVVDGREGIHPIDRELSHLLRRGNTPVIVVANKVDTKKTDPSAAEFAEFGYEHQVNVSATHGRNMDVLEQLMIDNFTNQQGSFDETTGFVREELDLFAISAAPTEFEWDDVDLTEKSDSIRTVYEQHDLQPCRFRDLSEAGNGSSNERSDDSVHETYPERLERAARASTGANPEFFRAGTDDHRNTIGFVADGVIFINVELEVAFGWTFAHEFGHIAEKNSDSGYETYVESLLTECMSPDEVEAIRTHAFAGIEDDFEVATEIANHVLGDATGTWSSGILDFLEQDDAAEDLALIFLEGILPSSPVPEKRSSAQTIEDEELARTPFEPPIKIAIVGRPNVGKSSLINAILNDQRSIVSDVAGTTRDAVDVPYSRNGKDYVLIDTAGIRKRVKRDTSVEVFSVMRSETSIQRADICLLVIDASSGVVSQDRRIAKMVLDAQKPCILLLNKFDLYFPDGSFQDRIDQFREDMGEDMFFLDYAPRVAISAKERQYLGKIFKQIQVVKEGAADPIPTGVLNRLLRTAIDRNPPPAKKGKRMKLLYATQKREDKQSLVPVPEYMLFLNYANLLTRTYERYLENKIREEYPMEGLPFIFSVSSRQGRNLETDRR